MSNHYIMMGMDGKERRYIPSYSRGFIAAGGLFFHKSGQIWELVGLPKEWSVYSERKDCTVLPNSRMAIIKVGNYTKEQLDTFFPGVLHLRFGPGSKVVAIRSGSDEVIKLKWRRCSLAEIKLREMLEEICG